MLSSDEESEVQNNYYAPSRIHKIKGSFCSLSDTESMKARVFEHLIATWWHCLCVGGNHGTFKKWRLAGGSTLLWMASEGLLSNPAFCFCSLLHMSA